MTKTPQESIATSQKVGQPPKGDGDLDLSNWHKWAPVQHCPDIRAQAQDRVPSSWRACLWPWRGTLCY